MTDTQDAWFEPDSEGCLLVVGSYSYRAGFVSEVTAQVSRQVLASPALSDFFDVKFADLGPLPDLGADPDRPAAHAQAVGRLVRELTRHGGFAARNYFAVVIVDRSAAAVMQLFRACSNDDIVGQLLVNWLGIASLDDRDRACRKADLAAALPIMVAADGSWKKSELVAELHRYAENLMSDFATAERTGISLARLDELRPEEHEEQAQTDDRLERPGPEMPRAASVAMLPAEAGRAGRAGGTGWGSRTAKGEPAPLPWRHVAARLPWRAGRALSDGQAEAGAPAEPRSRRAGVVYLILSSNAVTGEQASWRRSRSMLLALDDKLAAVPRIAYQVRAAQVAADVTRDNLRPAGQISRRGLKRTEERTDLSRVLAGINRAMTRDVAGLLRAGTSIVRPAVVIFAADAPLADLATIEAYEELVAKADITWVAPEKVLALLSPRFAQLSGTEPIVYHDAVADEVLESLLPPEPGPHPEPSLPAEPAP